MIGSSTTAMLRLAQTCTIQIIFLHNQMSVCEISVLLSAGAEMASCPYWAGQTALTAILAELETNTTSPALQGCTPLA